MIAKLSYTMWHTKGYNGNYFKKGNYDHKISQRDIDWYLVSQLSPRSLALLFISCSPGGNTTVEVWCIASSQLCAQYCCKPSASDAAVATDSSRHYNGPVSEPGDCLDVQAVTLCFFFNFFSFSSYQLQSYSTSHQYMNLSATGTNLRLVGLTVHGCLGPKPSGSMHIRIELLINIVHKHHSSHMTLHKESILK